MKNNTGQICVEFNRKAVKLFTFLYSKYEKSIQLITREKDELSFLRLNNQYVNTLKQQLDQTAVSIIEKYRITLDNIMSLQHLLTEQVNFYLNEFNHKTGLLYYAVPGPTDNLRNRDIY